jgi:hypothetical protein
VYILRDINLNLFYRTVDTLSIYPMRSCSALNEGAVCMVAPLESLRLQCRLLDEYPTRTRPAQLSARDLARLSWAR